MSRFCRFLVVAAIVFVGNRRSTQRFAPELAESFWRVDAELRALTGVKVEYGGKNFVHYKTRAGVFAEAIIGDRVITWRSRMKCSMHSDADTAAVLTLLRDASGRAG